jgi:hypothetical protein
MALLLILLALFSFLGFGSGSTGTGSASSMGTATATGSASSTVTQSSVQSTNGVTKATCIVVTWKAGEPAHRRVVHGPCPEIPAEP